MSNDFVLAVISFIIILGPLIIIHELGHFIACRMVGVTVLEFGIGIPPRAAKLFEWRGTDFTLNWLPVGGFVRPLGEDFVSPLPSPEAVSNDPNLPPPFAQQIARYEQYKADLEAIGKKMGNRKIKAMMEANPWQRILFLVAGAGFNFIAAYVILVLVATLTLPPWVVGVSPNSPAAKAGLAANDIIVKVNDKEVKNQDEILAALKTGAKDPLKVTVERQGERKDFTLNPATDRFAPALVQITDVTKGMPADGNFKVNDYVTKVDGVAISTNDKLREYIQKHSGKEVSFTVNRNGEIVNLKVTPKETKQADGSAVGMIGVGLVEFKYDVYTGVDVRDRAKGVPLNEAFGVGLRRTGDILQELISFPVKLIQGVLPIQQARPVSIVGISQIGGEALQKTIQERDPFWVLNFAALISIALGFTNLLPIPGLDGGRILFVIIEILRGKPMKPEREGMIHFVGLMIILGLFVILVINDIFNPIGSVLR